MSDHIKKRIIALLNLSRDVNNKNEAASAKRQADNLMRRYNLTEKDLYQKAIVRPTVSEQQVAEELQAILDLMRRREQYRREAARMVAENEARMREAAIMAAKHRAIRNLVLLSFGVLYIIFTLALLLNHK